MKKILLIFLLTSCSLNTSSNYWENNFIKEKLDFSKEYTLKEYKILLKKYNDRNGFPNIN